LAEIDACVGPVYDIGEALHDEHAQARGMVVKGEINGEPYSSLTSFPRISDVTVEHRLPPPEIGAHTDEVLRAIGYTDAELTQFRGEGII
ncbi:MAG TPA: CoA transferase, partial [Ktedonobacteraceae bacterium]|nr:CoA transferase [Ktedonobacteraceae bacterium]